MKKLLSLLLVLTMLCGAAAAEGTGYWHDKWLPDYEYTGETKVPDYMNTDSYFPIVKEGNDITLKIGLVYDETYTDPDQVKDSWFYTWFSKYTGVKFEFECIPKSALNERKTLLFLEDKLPDILLGFQLKPAELTMYGDMDGQLLDMGPYLNADLAPTIIRMFEQVEGVKPAITTSAGKIYTLPMLYSELDANGYAQSEVMYVNTDWLKTIGLEKAPDTLEGFTDMLYKFKAAYPDGIPLAASDGQQDVRSYILNAMGYLTDVENDTGYGPALRNGEVVIPAYTENFKDFLKIMNEYYVNGLIPQDYFTLDETAENAMLEKMNFGATNRGSMGRVLGQTLEDVKTKIQKLWTGYPLTSQWNDVRQVQRNSRVNKIGNACIASTTKYPELCVRLLDFWYTELGMIYTWEGTAFAADDNEKLGMILGHEVTPDYKTTYHDVAEGLKESGYYYAYGETSPIGLQFGNRSHSLYRPDEMYYMRMISVEMSGYEVTPYTLIEDSADDWFKLSKQEGFFPYLVDGYPKYVYLDEDTAQRLADLESVIKPFVDAEVAKFITGLNSIDQFDKFQEQLKNMGIEEYLKIYQDFYTAYVANK